MITLLEVVKRTADFLEKHGVESPRLNAELIIAHALGIGRMQVYLQFERPLTEAQLEAIRPLVRRRARREPLAYVLGTAAFGDLVLSVDRRVLVPRPETEQLVELIKDSVTQPPAAVLDLGTGSGALALALARLYPEARVTAVDASEEALSVARGNAARHGLEPRITFLRSHWFDALDPVAGRFGLIVANPPYLTEEEWASAEPEVRGHEPKEALVAPDGGSGDLLAIIAGAPRFLESQGWLFLETGVDQHERLLAALSAAGLQEPRSHQDWNGRDRFVSARMPG
jgi:release factor glutamine methyltransferase